jgi:hypothetical protein
MQGRTQSVAATVGTLGATAAIKKAVDATWRVGSKGKKPPTDPADPDVRIREAITFALISGAAIGVVRMLIARKLAAKERREAAAQRDTGV